MAYKRISPTPIVEGGTAAQSFTAYAPICGGTTTTGSLQSVVSAGSAGQLLTSNGAGALPTYQNPPGGIPGGWILIETQSVGTVASVDFTSGINGTYESYALAISSFYADQAGGVDVIMYVSDDGGATYKSSGYVSRSIFATAANLGSAGSWENKYVTSGMLLITGARNLTSDKYPSGGTFFIYNMGAASFPAMRGIATASYTNTNTIRQTVSGSYTTATLTVDALRVACSAGDIAGGIFSLYGIKHT